MQWFNCQLFINPKQNSRTKWWKNVNSLAQNLGNPNSNALESLKSFAKPWIVWAVFFCWKPEHVVVLIDQYYNPINLSFEVQDSLAGWSKPYHTSKKASPGGVLILASLWVWRHNYHTWEVLSSETWTQGAWFDIKMLSYYDRKPPCGDKMVTRSFYGISYTSMMAFLY